MASVQQDMQCILPKLLHAITLHISQMPQTGSDDVICDCMLIFLGTRTGRNVPRLPGGIREAVPSATFKLAGTIYVESRSGCRCVEVAGGMVGPCLSAGWVRMMLKRDRNIFNSDGKQYLPSLGTVCSLIAYLALNAASTLATHNNFAFNHPQCLLKKM